MQKLILNYIIYEMKSTKVQTLGGNIGTFGLETPLHAYVLGIQGIIQRTVYTYAKPLNMKHMRYSGVIRNALRVSKHVTESIRNIARGVGIN